MFFSILIELEEALSKLNIDESVRTPSEMFDSFLDELDNKSELKSFISNSLSEYTEDILTPSLLSEFHFLTQKFDIDNMDAVITQFKKSADLDLNQQIHLAKNLSNIDPDIIDSTMFQKISFYGVDGGITEHYPFLKGKYFNDHSTWDDVNIFGGYDQRPEFVFNTNVNLTEKETLIAIADALNESAINTSLKGKISYSEDFELAWKKDIELGHLDQPEFMSEENLDKVFSELFYRVNKVNPDLSWKQLSFCLQQVFEE